MIIDALSVLDFRVFSGAHTFDLAPRLKRGKPAPIVLFGGLNGGGKTTILSALKLALYGKGALGSSTTTADYHLYLRDCIHRAQNSIAKPSRAAVELTFRYAQHGTVCQYHLTRDWFVDAADKVKEGLMIARDGVPLSELSYEQAQSFLNELIPIGVSELFFFDGEKIASLAEETSGDALRESINKLLGLDIVERLDSDLAVLLKTRAAKKASKERLAKIEVADHEYHELQEQLASVRASFLHRRTDAAELRGQISKLDATINARGGAWTASKQAETANLDALVIQKNAIEHTLEEMLGGLLPLAITKGLNEKLLSQLDAEQRTSTALLLKDYVQRQQQKFAAELQAQASLGQQFALVNEVFERTFGAELSAPEPTSAAIHQLSDNHRHTIGHRLTVDVASVQQRAQALAAELHAIDLAIENAGENIARAPDENILLPLFDQRGQLQGRLSALTEQKNGLRENAQALLTKLAAVAKRLDDLHTEVAQSQEEQRLAELTSKARLVLKEFSARARVEKLKALQTQFYASFNGLARKEDRHLSITIDPDTFEVGLLDDRGTTLRKQELSAGEKQIFAISILEALARTSGRSLPVVIDTPLGRLDSIHRKKLVDNYFPKTSHQVIVLSTDTEIDREFYEGLQSSISHAYHLVYNHADRATQVEAGYFWRWGANA